MRSLFHWPILLLCWVLPGVALGGSGVGHSHRHGGLTGHGDDAAITAPDMASARLAEKKSADKSAKPAKSAAGKATGKPAKPAAGKATGKPAKPAAGKAADKPAKPAAGKAADKPAKPATAKKSSRKATKPAPVPRRVREPKPNRSACEVKLDDALDAVGHFKADRRKRRLRDQWLHHATRVEAIGRSCPGEAPRADYAAARLREELAVLSGRRDDLQSAVDAYIGLAGRHPRAALADDALLRAAVLCLDRLRDSTASRSILARLIRDYPDGDRRAEALRMYAELGGDPKAVAGGGPGAGRNDTEDRNSGGPRSGSETLDISPPSAEESRAVVPNSAPAPPMAEDDGHGHGGGATARGAKSRPEQPIPMDEPEADLPEEDDDAEPVRRKRDEQYVVVIDPGHGGKDSGAPNPYTRGLNEKEITLDVSRRVRDLFTDDPRIRVILTREDDRYLYLPERAQIANAHEADLFVSVHVNAGPSRRSPLNGIETFVLNVTSDDYTRRLADRENRANGEPIDDIEFILADLATQMKLSDSLKVAWSVHKAMVERARGLFPQVKDKGVKAALFYVLLHTRMPAILVEMGFITHRGEEAQLRNPAYRQEIARGIADGVREYFRGIDGPVAEKATAKP